MSSYVVDHKTIHKIIAGIKTHSRDRDDVVGHETKFGRKLLRMNEAAVDERYHDPTHRPGTIGQRGVEYRFVEVLPPTRVEFVKALRCFLYQCCEGSVPKWKLYKRMDDIVRCVSSSIVADLPEYDRAEWG